MSDMAILQQLRPFLWQVSKHHIKPASIKNIATKG
jgi:hypothetical protein